MWVHCAAGFRATIAASILERAGIRCAIVDDLIDVAAELGLAAVPDAPIVATDEREAPAPSRRSRRRGERCASPTGSPLVDSRGARVGAAVSVFLLVVAVDLQRSGSPVRAVVLVFAIALRWP